MFQEKSFLSRLLGKPRARVPFSESESDKFKAYWDLVVKRAMEKDSSLIQSDHIDPFYQAIEEASLQVHAEIVDQSKHDAKRRRLLTMVSAGAVLLGIGAAVVPPVYDWATAPYTDASIDRDMTEEEKKRLEDSNTLLGEMTPPSRAGWAISFDKKDPSKKWTPDSTFFAPRIQNFRQGESITVVRQGRREDSLIWLNSYTSSQGIALPVMEIETLSGPDPRIININQQIDPALDTTAIKLTNIHSNYFGYLAIRRIATPGGYYFEASSIKKEPI